MKHIIMSIQPQHVANILNGKKTVEIRKTAPKPPFTVWVYCTKNNNKKSNLCGNRKFTTTDYVLIDDNKVESSKSARFGGAWKPLNGQIVAKFVVEKVDRYGNIPTFHSATYGAMDSGYLIPEKLERDSCLDKIEIEGYANGKVFYALHIKDLVILDKPLLLGDFETENKDAQNIGAFGWATETPLTVPLTRAPQSWQYVAPKEL